MTKIDSADIQYGLGRNIKTEQDMGIFKNIFKEIKWKIKEIKYGNTVKEQLNTENNFGTAIKIKKLNNNL